MRWAALEVIVLRTAELLAIWEFRRIDKVSCEFQ